MGKILSKEGREEFALALFLWKEFKQSGKLDIEVHKRMFEMAEHVGVGEELKEFMGKFIWPIEIKVMK
jgi:hypothetical protein